MSQLAQDAPKTEFIGTHVDELTRDELIALARWEDRSMSWVLRRALTAYLERGARRRTESMSDPWVEYPYGRKLEQSGKPKDWLATLSVLAEATDDNVAAARRPLQQANPEDFETSGRVWTDRGSGQRYRLVHSQPLASPKPDKIADIFLVRDGYLVFLVRENRDDAETAELGAVGGSAGKRKKPRAATTAAGPEP